VIDKDHHFELLPSLDATDGAAFGIGLAVSLDDNGFAPGSTDWAVQDGENSQNGTTAFGRDRLLGPVWNWQLHVNRDNEERALETLRSFRTAWHALQIRSTPGAVLPLRYQLNGERRRIYGRPRRFEAPPDNKIMSGYVPVSVDFKCVDGFIYADQMQSVSMLLGADIEAEGVDSGGGFVFPVIFPVVTLPPTQRQTQVEVVGDAPSYPIIRFTANSGALANPGFVTDDWRLDLNFTIPSGSYIEVDTRPWVNTALLNGAGSVAGHIGHRQRMSKMFFNPGRLEGRFVGSSGGTATCTVSWADTFNSY
jgi:hypothetical protein